MNAKPTFIMPRTSHKPHHILRDLYLQGSFVICVNVRESQRGGMDPSLWSYLALIQMVVCNIHGSLLLPPTSRNFSRRGDAH
jgi:hypothetical protein